MLIKEYAAHQYNNVILPYWQKLKDEENGGFYSLVDFDLNVHRDAPKGVILNSRILWFFSQCYLHDKSPINLSCATHAYDFLMKNCFDHTNNGVYWMVSFDGKPLDTTKHTYNQAFAIYALCSYYEAVGCDDALSQATSLFELIETKAADQYGYLEAFSEDWYLIENDKLSENGIIADKTMNTLLHLTEAYTELYRLSGNKDVAYRLNWLLQIFKTKVYNKSESRLDVFFDNKLNSLIDLQSFGHDIEASWLLDRASQVLKQDDQELMTITTKLVDTVCQRAFSSNGIHNECFNKTIDTTRVWWVQAEAVVGLYNKYEQTKKEEYLQKAIQIFEYINKTFQDKRPGGEWFWDVDKNAVPQSRKPITEPWKCPYHNGRMCLEIFTRSLNNE